MKISFLLTQDLASPSGLGRYLPWAKELARLGHEVIVIALHPDFDNLPQRKLTVEGVQVEYVAQMHVRKQGNQKTYFSPLGLVGVAINATLQIFRAAMKHPADSLVVGKPHPMNSLAAVLTRVFRPKVRLIVDCDDHEAASNRFQGAFQKKVVGWFENWTPKRADLVTTNTYYTLRRLEKTGIARANLVYVPNGIDEARFSMIDRAEVEALREDYGLQGKKIVSYIGSMSLPSHPVDLLLKAFALIKDRLPDAILMLVGGGEDLAVLKQIALDLAIDDRVLFIGRVPPEDVANYYAMSSVSVDPVNDDEAARGRCPLKMFESWACGVPFITADVGDRKILAGDPPAALLVAPGDSAALGEGVVKLLRSRELAESLTQNGAVRSVEFYWENIVKNSEQVFAKKQNIMPSEGAR